MLGTTPGTAGGVAWGVASGAASDATVAFPLLTSWRREEDEAKSKAVCLIAN